MEGRGKEEGRGSNSGVIRYEAAWRYGEAEAQVEMSKRDWKVWGCQQRIWRTGQGGLWEIKHYPSDLK